MSYALSLAKKNLGITAPNPVVGCVIVKDGQIISTGVTSRDGRPHAEKNAIDGFVLQYGDVKDSLFGANIYVTLEPCCHFGKTSPCIDEIIRIKPKRVVVAALDPDVRVNGEGVRLLRESGIEVVIGVMEKEAQEINRGFFKSNLQKTPFVTLKIATSLDGKIATKNYDSKWITSEKSRQFSHYLRAVNDAILIGANTVRKDDPMLNCRILGLENFSPRKVVISGSVDLNPDSKIFQKLPDNLLTILTIKKEKIALDEQCYPSNVEVIFCAEKDGRVDLKDALIQLCKSGINSLLVEGGSDIATQFIAQNLVDELVWIRSKKIIGDDGIPAIGSMNFTKISEVINLFSDSEIFRQKIINLEGDLIEIYKF